MITLARLNGKSFILNADFIETLEATPDTVVTLTNSKKMIVKDSVDEVVRKTIEYKQRCHQTFTVVTSTESPRTKDVLNLQSGKVV